MEIVPHTVKEWKTGENFNLDGPRTFAKRCQQEDAVFFSFLFFYFSAGAPKTPSSLNKPVQGFSSKNVRSEKKRLVSSNHD